LKKFNFMKNKQIPKNWIIKKLNDVSKFLDNRRIPLESEIRSKKSGIYPYYGASGIIDYINEFIFDENLILLGEDGANILDRSSRLCFIATGKYWVNNHAHVIKPDKNTSIYFLCEYLESLDYTKYNTGSAQPKLNRKVCESIPVLLPPLPEQTAIVSVLETWDKSIELLKQKILLKQQIKQGLMQNLLTGKTRLPGFVGEWEEKKLGEISLIGDGNHSALYPKHNEIVKSGIPFIRGNNISHGIVLNKNLQYITPEKHALLKKGHVKANDIIIVNRGEIGKIGLVPLSLNNSNLNSQLAWIRIINNNYKFIYFLFFTNEIQAYFKNNQSGGALQQIGIGDLKNLLLNLPPLPEQTAIASILTTADIEIETLQTKLTALQAQKKYLLNNLITGDIRLPQFVNP
jgi:type I restriction enzyme, S subunit